MKIQVNSDKTISVNASLIRFVKGEMRRVLGRFATRLTRIEVHLSDVDNRKTGQADKRCLVEARPAGARPVSTRAKAGDLGFAVGQAGAKMKRLLTTFFSRKGRRPKLVLAPAPKVNVTRAKNEGGKKPGLARRRRISLKKSARKKPAKLSPRGPKKKWIYRARRKPWPKR